MDSTYFCTALFLGKSREIMMRIFAALLLLGLASEGWTEQTIDDNEIWGKSGILYLKYRWD